MSSTSPTARRSRLAFGTRRRRHKTRCGLDTATSPFTTRSPRQGSPSSTWAQGTPTRARLLRVGSSRRLKSRALLNESPGAGYLERRWAEPFKKSGAWPVSALRQAFLNGTLERLLEPDSYLKAKLPGFVMNGDFGYASGAKGDGYSRVWFRELLPQEEISFDSDVYLLLPKRAQELKAGVQAVEVVQEPPGALWWRVETGAGPLFAAAEDRGCCRSYTRKDTHDSRRNSD